MSDIPKSEPRTTGLSGAGGSADSPRIARFIRVLGRRDAEIARLRIALEEISKHDDPHTNGDGDEIDQDPTCFCPRCIAARALWLPNAESSEPASRDQL
jgi:hypothetical protein